MQVKRKLERHSVGVFIKVIVGCIEYAIKVLQKIGSYFMEYLFSGHSFKRMAERRFSPDMIKSIIKKGIIIKEYPDDTPYPSRLILGYDGNRPIHVVAAYNQNDDMEYIITAYEPDAQLWNSDFTKRRN